MKRYLALILILILSLTLVVGCGNSDSEDKTLKFVYGEWDSTIASNNLIKAVLEEKLGYDVELTSVSMSAIWQGVAQGDADGAFNIWLPTTHADYYEEFKDEVIDLGVNLDGTKLGLVVPEYVEDINSIEDLKGKADMFDGEIIGIDPGAGLMLKTNDVVKEYGLEEYDLIESSDAAMVAALSDALANEEPIIVTGWSPHWKFGRWDLKYLEDPKLTYGGDEQIHTIVRKGLQKDHPEAYKFLDNFNWAPEDMEELMNMNQEEGTDPYENAKIWMEENEDKVNAWLE